MSKGDSTATLPTVACLAILLVCFSVVCAFVLDRFVESYKFVGSHAEFDIIALLDSTLVITSVVLICWTLLFVLGVRKPAFGVTPLVSLASYAGIVALLYSSEGSGYRASAVLANGGDLAIMPVVIPILSLVSGLSYSASLKLAKLSEAASSKIARSRNRNAA
jgi:hypothetical protein